MSKYLVFNSVCLKDRDTLIAALISLGYIREQITVGQNIRLYGYRGDRRQETADVVIRKEFVGGSSNDLGFRLTPDGYVPIISEYDVGYLASKHHVDDFSIGLQVAYTEAAMRQLAESLYGSYTSEQEGQVTRIVIQV